MAPSTFASAAAGNNQTQSATRDGPSEWSRRNGATQTFRRQSNANTSSPSSTNHDSSALTSSLPPRYVPPHRNGTLADMRYTKSQLLDLFRQQQGADGSFGEGLQHLYINGWQPEAVNGSSAGAWGRGDHSRDAQPGPEVCWDRDGLVEPLGIIEMDDDEKELFSNSVNTPLKPAGQNKENQQSNGHPSRKISISHNAQSPGGFGLPSPSVSRNPRRRDTSESYPFPNALNTNTNSFGRDDQRAASPPPSLTRRRTDMKDDGTQRGEQDSTPFGTVKRNPTAGPLSAGLAGPSSPWASTPQNSAFSPMGSFGNLGLGPTQQGAQPDKRAGIGSGRAESRFKNLLQKDSSEDVGGRTLEQKGSISSLHKHDEAESWRHNRLDDPLDEGDEDALLPSGSAALASESDLSPPHTRHGLRGFDTPSRNNTRDEHGFGAFGMTADNAPAFAQQTPSHQRPGQHSGHEPMSPTDTNPYKSPEQHNVQRLHHDPEEEEGDMRGGHLPGLGGFGIEQAQQHLGFGGLGNLGGLGQGPASDRSQTSSVGPTRAFPGLGGLGQLGAMPGSTAWPSHGRPGMGLPSPFGSGIFATSAADMQSPGLAGLGGSNLLNPQSAAGFGGPRMFQQDQLRNSEHTGDWEQHHSGMGGHEQDFRNAGDDASTTESQNAGTAQQSTSQDQNTGQSNQPPAPQQRTMVMPDRMRWIYKDPQGQTQGPWSGLEMHDWYRAGFFSPELLVKKAEDADYEPLAQLIRRIGNSREPFLVPQIGIAHGAPSTSGPWAGTVNATTAGNAQPPFPSSFPSFGTTLTAEQQNALERRKQEEQYLMARQKEHLAQAQIAQRIQHMQAPVPGFTPSHIPNSLTHHASAQSLHSQPSFGSMTSPSAYQPSPVQGPSSAVGHGSVFDSAHRNAQAGGLGAVGAGVESLGHIREEEIPSISERVNASARMNGTNQFGAPGQALPRNVQQSLQDRALLQQEQAQHDASQLDIQRDAQNERLREFQQLQGQAMSSRLQNESSQEPLSLTEQVQQAASAKHSPAVAQQAWGKIEGGLPQAFPPAPSQSPLPAPAAQRTGRQSVADQLHAETSRSQTPSVDTPSAAVAPWAKESSDQPKGPSLREIQEMEAKKAAEAEEIAMAARRALLQKEMEAQAIAAANSVTIQPGLPAAANWAAMNNGTSPATPTNVAGSPWSKTAQKPVLTQTKSMAQIQKEEEARKKKLAASQVQASASAMTSVSNPAGGKSYANLAGKPGATPVGASGAWTTVGASGKVKTPGAAPTMTRTASSGVVPPAQAASSRKLPVRSTTMTGAGAVNAQDEFKKWAVAELKPDLSKGITAEDFVVALISLGPDVDIITEAVHGSSNTIDSRHFAEEFIRRKKLADKGLVDASAPPKSASPHNAGSNTAGGWNEVAKKGPVKEAAKEEGNGNFRVVAAKKKSGKR